MNWSKDLLIFNLFVLGISVIYFVVTSYQFPHLVEQEVALESHEEKVTKIPQIRRRYAFSDNQNNYALESEDTLEAIVDTPPDGLEQVREGIANALSAELKLKAERHAKLAKILPVIKEQRYQK